MNLKNKQKEIKIKKTTNIRIYMNKEDEEEYKDGRYIKY